MNQDKRGALRLLGVAAATAALAPLAGCVPLVLGGAAVGTLVAIDRRTTGTQIEDEGIELRGAGRLREAFGERAHITVVSYNRQVLLTGEVPTEADKQRAEQIIAGVENVRAVFNELGVMAVSSLAQRSNDVLVSSKVRATLVDARDLFVGAFRVNTERGTTYLMGRVTQREADRATQLTRSVPGVLKVVRLFEIISEEELSRIAPKAAPTAPRSPS